jgi:hypothetical protein
LKEHPKISLHKLNLSFLAPYQCENPNLKQINHAASKRVKKLRKAEFVWKARKLVFKLFIAFLT